MLKGEMLVATQLQPSLDSILTDRLGVALGAVGQVWQSMTVEVPRLRAQVKPLVPPLPNEYVGERQAPCPSTSDSVDD